MPAKIASVLFDMDGVLYNYDRAHRLQLLADALDVPADDIDAAVFKSGLEDDHDWGRIDVDSYIAEIGKRLGRDVTLRQWRAARKWSMSPEMPMIQLARDLGTRFDIALMTNNGTFMADAIDEMAPELRGVFGDKMFFSGILGCGKEAAPTFGVLMDRLGWQHETTLFVDDDPTYIAAGQEAGVIAHRFDGIDGLRSRLAELGISSS